MILRGIVTFFQMTFDRRTFDFDIVTCAPLVSCPSNIRLGQKWMLGTNTLARGARKLTGENLKLVWAEFSTLSQAVLMMSIYLFT